MISNFTLKSVEKTAYHRHSDNNILCLPYLTNTGSRSDKALEADKLHAPGAQ